MASRKRKSAFVTPFSQSSQPAVIEANSYVRESSGKDVPIKDGEPDQMSPLLVGRMQVVTPNMRKKIKRRFACRIFHKGTSLTQESSPGVDVPFLFSQDDDPDILHEVPNDIPYDEQSATGETLEHKLNKSNVSHGKQLVELREGENNVHIELVHDPGSTDGNNFENYDGFFTINDQQKENAGKETLVQRDKANVQRVMETYKKVAGNRRSSPTKQATPHNAITVSKAKPELVNKNHVHKDKRQDLDASKRTSTNERCPRRKKTHAIKTRKFREEEIHYSVLKELMKMHMEINDLQSRRKLLKLPDGYTSINRLLPTQAMKDFPNHAQLYEE